MSTVVVGGGTATRPDARPRVTTPAARDATTRAVDAVLDAATVGFALFTLAYHAALVLDLTIAACVVLWVLAAIVASLVAVVVAPRAAATTAVAVDVDPVPRAATIAGIVGAVAALVLGRTLLDDARWWLFEAVAVVALLLGAGAVLRGRVSRAQPRTAAGPIVVAPIVAIVLALVFGLGALLTVRPDADDVLTVNRSVWIEHRGDRFPERDTLFSDEQFSYTRPENPSPAIEPFIGVIARYTPFSAPTVAYLVVAPAVSFLAVLALWRLLRALRATLPWLALVVATVYLAFDGTLHASLGSFSFVRAWQGKAILVFLAVPVLWRHALAWGRDGERRALVMLVAANVAAVGLSTTALLIAPPITVVGVLAGLRRDVVQARVTGLVAALVYPAGGALFALVANRQPVSIALAAGGLLPGGRASPVDVTRGLSSWEPWYFVFGTGVTATIAAVATLCGWLGTRDRAAKLALLGAPLLLFAVLVSPPALHALHGAASEGDSVLWRLVWVLPVPAMVGLLATGVLARHGARAVVGSAIVVTMVCVVGGTPVWSRSNGARVVSHPEWDVGGGDLHAADRLLSMTKRGDVVATPEDARGNVGGAIAIQTVDVRAVDPRGKYLVGRHTHDPAFHPNERRLVTRAMTSGIAPSELGAFVASLKLLSVDAACSRPGLETGIVGRGLDEAGFRAIGHDDECVYWSHRRA